jgi:hypothetical protein
MKNTELIEIKYDSAHQNEAGIGEQTMWKQVGMKYLIKAF